MLVRPVSNAGYNNYGLLNSVSGHNISLQKIEPHWDDMLRLGGSLKLGRVPAAAIMRTLQVGERPTRLAQAIAEFGRIDNREGQEDQLGALGLVLNMIVMWNTSYMKAALTQLRGEGFDVRDEDVARLSPLLHEHINILG